MAVRRGLVLFQAQVIRLAAYFPLICCITERFLTMSGRGRRMRGFLLSSCMLFLAERMITAHLDSIYECTL